MNSLAGVVLRLMFAAPIIAFGALFSSTTTSQTPPVQISPAEAIGKTVIDMTAEELLQAYHKELSHLEFNQSQDELHYLLEKVGERVESFFRDFSNTSSKERVVMQRYGFNGLLLGTLHKEFRYLILTRSVESGLPWIEEDRADKENLSIKQEVVPGFLVSSGHASLCIYLHPSHQAYSRFRYLGRETKKPRSHVIAFAQKPELKDYLARYSEFNSSTWIRYLVQGFVWLDPDSYQILRMRTSMQLPERPTNLKEQVSDIHYAAVQFDGTKKTFWLPREVDCRWDFPDLFYSNQHKYSDYQLFNVESDYKITQPKVNK